MTKLVRHFRVELQEEAFFHKEIISTVLFFIFNLFLQEIRVINDSSR